MKVRVFMKDPDALCDAVEGAVDSELDNTDPSDDEQGAVRGARIAKALDVAGDWWKYGEYLVVEFDTDTKTARIVPVAEQ